MIYENLIQSLGSDEYNSNLCRVNFETETLTCLGKNVIKDGIYDGDIFDKEFTNEEILNMIYDLYESFKYSVPRSDTKKRSYFKAVSMDELTDEQLFCDETRSKAQIALEAFILCVKLSNQFHWDNKKYGNWFWKSKKDQDLVVLKKWLVK